MRQIGNLDSKQYANRFADYLTARGIASQVEERNGEWSIWIKDEDHLDDSRAELASFRENSDDPRYAAAALEAQQVRQQEQTRRERAARNTVDVRQSWNRPFARRAPLTSALIGVSVVVGLLSDSVFRPQAGEYRENEVFRSLALCDEALHRQDPTWRGDALVDVAHGQIWRLVTPAFLHLGLGHLIFNMIMCYSLGGMIESRQNALRIATLFVLCSTAGNLGEYFFSGGIGVGMSGVVYGFFGYLCVYRFMAPQDQLGVRNDTIVILIVWLVLGFTGVLEQLLGVSVANFAHLFGMLMGMVVAVVAIWLDANLRKRRPPKLT